MRFPQAIEGDEIKEPTTFIADNGILTKQSVVVKPFIPDLGYINETIYKQPTQNIPEPLIVTEPISTPETIALVKEIEARMEIAKQNFPELFNPELTTEQSSAIIKVYEDDAISRIIESKPEIVAEDLNKIDSILELKQIADVIQENPKVTIEIAQAIVQEENNRIIEQAPEVIFSPEFEEQLKYMQNGEVNNISAEAIPEITMGTPIYSEPITNEPLYVIQKDVVETSEAPVVVAKVSENKKEIGFFDTIVNFIYNQFYNK